MGLAQIYKKYALQAEAGKEAAKQISWIKDKLLHIYYQNSIDDRWVKISRRSFNISMMSMAILNSSGLYIMSMVNAASIQYLANKSRFSLVKNGLWWIIYMVIYGNVIVIN